MTKKIKFMFFLIILLFLVIGAASANDDNATDIIQEDQNDTTIATADLNENESDSGKVLEVSNEKTDEIKTNEIKTDEIKTNEIKTDAVKSDSATNTIKPTTTSQTNNNVVTSTQKETKTKFKIIPYSNFVKNGKKYIMYLVDSKGKTVANKKVKITINGKTYERTTYNSGKFTIKINTKKPWVKLKINVNGDKKHYSLYKKLWVYVENFNINIGNSKLLTNGYLRVYLEGSKKLTSKKILKVTIGSKTFTKRTNYEGYIVIKPKVSPKLYKIAVKFGKYKIYKNVKCIKGDVINPLKHKVRTNNGVPDVDRMPKNFVMGYEDGKYTLLGSQSKETIKRDSYCLFLYNKIPQYTFFKTKHCPNTYHILKREKWNVIERAINTKLVKAYRYNYWPSVITVNLKGKQYTYPMVRDIQNTGYNCGPTSASVCSQALKKYYSEKYFEIEGNCVDGMNIPVLKNLLEDNGFKTHYFYDDSFYNAMKELKSGAAIIAYLPNHYVSVVDISPDGKKILVSNSYGSYDVGCREVPTNWVSLNYFKSKFAGVGLVVKLDYKLSDYKKLQTKYYYKSMGYGWTARNVNERIPDVGS